MCPWENAYWAAGHKWPAGTPHLDANGRMVFDFDWPRPGFPGTIVAGKFQEPFAADAGSQVRVYLVDRGAGLKSDAQQLLGKSIAATASRQYLPVHPAIWSDRNGSVEYRRVARRYAPSSLGAGDSGHCGRAAGQARLLPAAGQYHRPSVVGKPGERRDAERCMDHERDVPVRGA